MSFSHYSVLRQGIFALLVLAAQAWTLFSAPPAHAAENKDLRVIGQWRLTAALDHSEIAAMDEQEAGQFVGKVMMISQDSVRFGTRKCLPPALDTTYVQPKLYLRKQAHADASKLRLPDPVTVVNLGCTIAFVKNTNHLVIHWDGWFFDAARIKR